ncbi:MAG: hypothetical protein LBQ47_03680 [Endomicrobium sp.]|nr:hypothetical protein [Endomicrobium sp.]
MKQYRKKIKTPEQNFNIEYKKLREAFTVDVLRKTNSIGEYVYNKAIENVSEVIADKNASFNKRRHAEMIIDFINKLTPKSMEFLSNGNSPSINVVLGKDIPSEADV